MLIKLQRGYVYLSHEQVDELEKLVLEGRNLRDLAKELFGPDYDWLSVWHKVTVRLHQLITQKLEADAENKWALVWAKYGRFNLSGADATKNVLNVLHAYSLITRQAFIKPFPRNLGEDVHNRQVLGTLWGYLCGDSGRLFFNTRRRSLLVRFIQRDFDTSVIIRTKDVGKIAGEARSFSIFVRDVEIRFSDYVSIDLYPDGN